MAATVDSIRAHVAQYLEHEIEWRDFETWLVYATWNVHRSGEQGAIDLTFVIEGALAELTSGYTTEDDFRYQLVSLASDVGKG